jgi:hypothetical protein
MRPKQAAFFVISTVAIFGCQDSLSDKIKDHSVESSVKMETGRLMPINSNDTNYLDVRAYAYDTLTQDGWSINYFIRDDSTRYTDLYIQWSKGNIKQIYNAEDVLQLRRHFIPTFIGENKSHLFLSHGCATGCQAILTLEKAGTLKGKDFIDVVDWSVKANKVVSVSDSTLKIEPLLELSVFDLNRNIERKVLFKNLCMAASFKPSCVDTIVFSKNLVKIRAELIDKEDYYREKNVVETRSVSFD